MSERRETEPMLSSPSLRETKDYKKIKIEKGSLSYLSRSVVHSGHRCSLQRLLCSAFVFSTVLATTLFMWEKDYIQPHRILAQFPFKWMTQNNQTLGFVPENSSQFVLSSTISIHTIKTNHIPNNQKLINIKPKLSSKGTFQQRASTKGFRQKINKLSKQFHKAFAKQILMGGAKKTTNSITSVVTDPKSASITRQSIHNQTLSIQSKLSSTASKQITIMPTRSPSHYITLDFQGRLGNLLFQYASLRGIAAKNNLIPVISQSLEINKYFHLTSSKRSNFHKFEKKYREKKGCTFEPETMSLGENNNYRLWGYYQSWKYFKNVENSLRKEFIFSSGINKIANEQFLAIASDVKRSSKGEITYVAVHVRRGDMISQKVFIDYGYVAADVDYINRALQYFRAKFQNPIFIMASDDQNWCKNNFHSDNIKFVKSGNTAAVDMAILTKCQHAILTVGSYGWWVGWMINGVTVFYKDYPKPGTKLAAVFKSEDYIPSNWIGL